MATYYVRRDGKDSNAGTADSSGGAWHSIQYATDQLAAGDTLNIQSGTWLMTSRCTAADGTWPSTSTFTSATATFQTDGVGAGDYLFCYDPGTSQYQSFMVQSVDSQTQLTLSESAGSSGTASDRNYWVCAADKMPELQISLTSVGDTAGNRVYINGNGASIDCNGAILVCWLLTNCNNLQVTGPLTLFDVTGALIEIAGSGSTSLIFDNVEAHSSSYYGFYNTDTSCKNILLRNCYAHDCINAGFSISTNGLCFLGCRSFDNGAGFWFSYGGNSVIEDCIAAGNASHGFRLSVASPTMFQGNIAYGNGENGLLLPSGIEVMMLGVIDNILYNNGNGSTTFDFNHGPTEDAWLLAEHNNCFVTYSGFTPDGSDVIADPKFFDPDNDDFRLHDSSPCWEAGFANSFITGNVQHIGPVGRKIVGPKARAAMFANPRQTI